jgi:hypothetical protein
MKQEHKINFEKLRVEIRQISELSKQLETMRKETLAALISDNIFNEARQRAFENMRVSPDAVRDEIRFMREILDEFSNQFLTDETKKDKLYSWVILNEHKYFEYWLEHSELKEVALSSDVIKLLEQRICDTDIPRHIMNYLRALDIDYVFELVGMVPEYFMKFREFGELTMYLLTNYVESLGFYLGYKIRYSEQDKQYYTLK